jgi:hypothetical protein
MGGDLWLAGQTSNIHSVYALISLTAYLILSGPYSRISWMHSEYSLGLHIGQPDGLSSIVLVMPSN